MNATKKKPRRLERIGDILGIVSAIGFMAVMAISLTGAWILPTAAFLGIDTPMLNLWASNLVELAGSRRDLGIDLAILGVISGAGLFVGERLEKGTWR
ncbi:MAG: hypothetical protein JRE71_19750 [Deltaproteobacteria bacterium]|nr:hypothetical protein [Deltaproteobacteria bacterium]